MLLHHVGRIKAFFLETDRAVLPWLLIKHRDGSETAEDLRTPQSRGLSSCQRNSLQEGNCQASAFFIFLLLTSAVKIRWRENGGHASDNGFIIQSHTLFKQPLHSADSKRQQGIDSGRLIIKKINEYEWKRWADVGR